MAERLADCCDPATGHFKKWVKYSHAVFDMVKAQTKEEEDRTRALISAQDNVRYFVREFIKNAGESTLQSLLKTKKLPERDWETLKEQQHFSTFKTEKTVQRLVTKYLSQFSCLIEERLSQITEIKKHEQEKEKEEKERQRQHQLLKAELAIVKYIHSLLENAPIEQLKQMQNPESILDMTSKLDRSFFCLLDEELLDKAKEVFGEYQNTIQDRIKSRQVEEEDQDEATNENEEKKIKQIVKEILRKLDHEDLIWAKTTRQIGSIQYDTQHLKTDESRFNEIVSKTITENVNMYIALKEGEIQRIKDKKTREENEENEIIAVWLSQRISSYNELRLREVFKENMIDEIEFQTLQRFLKKNKVSASVKNDVKGVVSKYIQRHEMTMKLRIKELEEEAMNKKKEAERKKSKKKLEI